MNVCCTASSAAAPEVRSRGSSAAAARGSARRSPRTPARRRRARARPAARRTRLPTAASPDDPSSAAPATTGATQPSPERFGARPAPPWAGPRAVRATGVRARRRGPRTGPCGRSCRAPRQRRGPSAQTGHHGAGVLLARRGRGRRRAAGRAVRDAQRLAVLGDQVVRVARRVAGAARVLAHDLARVRVVGGDDDQRVGVRCAGSPARRRSRCRTRPSRRSARTRSRRGPACRSRRPRPGGRSRRGRPRAARSPCSSSPAGSARSPGGCRSCSAAPACRRRGVATGPFHSVVMLPAVNRPSSGRSRALAAARPAASVTSVIALALRRTARPSCRRPGRRRSSASKRSRPPPSDDVDLVVDGLLGDRAEAAGRLRLGRAGRRVSVGPWQPRREMCESSTAGVASVISAVDTLPAVLPCFCALSSTVAQVLARARRSALLGPCEMRSSIVFCPVAHIVPVEAESGS